MDSENWGNISTHIIFPSNLIFGFFLKIQQAGISQSQQYKQAGNGIVVQVLEAIFKNLFKGEINNE